MIVWGLSTAAAGVLSGAGPVLCVAGHPWWAAGTSVGAHVAVSAAAKRMWQAYTGSAGGSWLQTLGLVDKGACDALRAELPRSSRAARLLMAAALPCAAALLAGVAGADGVAHAWPVTVLLAPSAGLLCCRGGEGHDLLAPWAAAAGPAAAIAFALGPAAGALALLVGGGLAALLQLSLPRPAAAGPQPKPGTAPWSMWAAVHLLLALTPLLLLRSRDPQVAPVAVALLGLRTPFVVGELALYGAVAAGDARWAGQGARAALPAALLAAAMLPSPAHGALVWALSAGAMAAAQRLRAGELARAAERQRRVVFAFGLPVDAPTGGTVYQLRVVDELRAAGRPVDVVVVDSAAAARALVADVQVRPAVVLLESISLLHARDALGALRAAAVAVACVVHSPFSVPPYDAEPWLVPIQRACGGDLAGLERWLFARCDRLLAAGDDTARRLVADYGVPAAYVEVLPPPPPRRGSVPRRRAGCRSPLQLLMCGTVCERKNQLVLARAASRVRGVRLTLVGGLDAEPDYVARVARVPGVELEGPVAPAEALRRMADADAFAFSSTHESYGMAPAEAASVGLPVVCGRGVGALEAILPPASTIFVDDVADEEAWVGALSSLVSGIKELQSLAVSGGTEGGVGGAGGAGGGEGGGAGAGEGGGLSPGEFVGEFLDRAVMGR